MAQEIRDELSELQRKESVNNAELSHVRADIADLKEDTRRIADAIGMIAAQGEKVDRLEKDVEGLGKRLGELNQRVGDLALKVDRHRNLFRIAGAVVMAAVAAAFTAFFKWLDK